MVTAIVQYKLPPHIDSAACAAHYRAIAAGFREVQGLIGQAGLPGAADGLV